MVNTKFESLLFIDLETVGVYPDLETCLKENPLLGKVFLNNFSWFQQRYPKDAHLDENEMFIQKAALIPEFAKIVSFAFCGTDAKSNFFTKSYSDKDEISVLKKINTVLDWAKMNGITLCGHNIKNFDIPMIAKRSFINGMKPHEILPSHNTKPWDIKVVDTKEIWQYGTNLGIASLDSVCGILGIDTPKDGEVSGVNLHKYYWSDGDLNKISEYCLKDAVTVSEIIKKLQNLN